MCNCYLCTRDTKIPLDKRLALKRGIELYNEIRQDKITTSEQVTKFKNWFESLAYNYQRCSTITYFIEREALFGYDTLDKLTSADPYATIPQRYGGLMPDSEFYSVYEREKETNNVKS
jgi:hypothetical protein